MISKTDYAIAMLLSALINFILAWIISKGDR